MMTQIRIAVQLQDFSLTEESDLIRARRSDIGALVTFSGLVRDLEQGRQVSALFLEHYPGMTEKSLQAIAEEAARRWALTDITIIHRIGELQAGEQIVGLVVASAHREAAFAAAAFIMDYLKTEAPFWKKCRDDSGESWVAAKASDSEAVEKWRR